MKSLRSVVILLAALFFLLPACGSKDNDDDDESFNANDRAVVFGANCLGCHQEDGADISGTSVAAVLAAINAVPDMEDLRDALSDEELLAVASYLEEVSHSSGWRREGNHGEYVEHNGVSLCEDCHGGTGLGGDADFSPSCFSCHGRKW